MNNIEIGRYGTDEAKDLTTGKGFSGWISGENNDGRGWILWLDETGQPACFFGNREPDGIVHGPMVRLTAGVEEVCA